MLVINQKQLDKFVSYLKQNYNFFDGRGDVLPFKRHFFPPKQVILTQKKNKISVDKPREDFILYGLFLVQLEALTQLDEIMKKPNEDFFYFQNRKKATVIGVVDENMDVVPGGDVVLQQIDGGKYKVWTPTTKGKKFIEENKKFFKEAKDSEQSIEVGEKLIVNDMGEWRKSMRELLLDAELLSDAVEWSKDHKIWDELGEKCLGCGICTYVCPLCHCFSIEDSVGLDDVCRRCRKWDACTLPNFSKVAGNHSFRPSMKSRYYNWFYHKFVRAYGEYGKSQCVGCGACKKSCPAGIDIQEILKKILEDYKKVNKK